MKSAEDDRQAPEQEGRQLLAPEVWVEEREYRGLQAEAHGLASDKIMAMISFRMEDFPGSHGKSHRRASGDSFQDGGDLAGRQTVR